MLLDLSELDPRGMGLDTTVEIPPFAWEAGEKVSCDPAHLVGGIKPTRRGIELAGHISTVVHQHCFRCLAAFDRPLETDFRLFLLPPPGEDGETEYDAIPDDDPDAVDLYPLEGPAVDLGVVLREQVDLALPLRALCREECRGLCSGCGADLNQEPCRCQPLREERLAALEQLKRVLEQKKGNDPSPGR